MEKNIASIYRITNNINGKCYVGFDISYPKRLQQHFNDSKRGKESPLCEDIRFYGWENFTKELIYQSWDNEYCLKIMEKHFIIENNSFIDGYNRTLGGNGSLKSPRPKSEEWRKKHSERMKKNNPRTGHKFTKEEKIKHSEKMKEFYLNNPEKILFAEKNPMFGKKHSEEWRKKHSEKMKKNTNSVKSMTVKRPCNKCGFVTTLGNLARYHNEKCKKIVL
jgi:group I intron endonuclease